MTQGAPAATDDVVDADLPTATVRTRSGIELQLPPQNLRFMGDTDESFVAFGSSLAALLVENGLHAKSSVLDIGSGYGRLAIGLLVSTDFDGRYLGFDILKRHVRWCRAAITPSFPTVRFALLDIRNSRYNPRGKIEPEAVSFPTHSRAFDLCAVFSVFTHQHRTNIERYLAEIRRVLRPGGSAVTTWFSFDDERLPAVVSPECAYPMVHVIDATTRYTNPDDQLHAIAYHESAIREMVATAGLELVSFERGSWVDGKGRWFQDLAVVRRPASDRRRDQDPPGYTFTDRARRKLRRLTHRQGG